MTVEDRFRLVAQADQMARDFACTLMNQERYLPVSEV